MSKIIVNSRERSVKVSNAVKNDIHADCAKLATRIEGVMKEVQQVAPNLDQPMTSMKKDVAKAIHFLDEARYLIHQYANYSKLKTKP